MVLLLVMVVGGCAGSAAGGPKVVRHPGGAPPASRDPPTFCPRAKLVLRYRAGPCPTTSFGPSSLALLYVGGYFVFGVALVWMGEPLVDPLHRVAGLPRASDPAEAVGPMGASRT